ncbi:MAG TPA: alpha/beta fold hydrolase [Burkholderiaceae bacterium]|jgi:hypothetical protein
MNAQTEKRLVPGPAGQLELALDKPAADVPVKGLALICHPNPTQGGTMDNKVVQTLARAFLQMGWRTVRFNFRGIGQSEGVWDEGRGEVDDALAALQATRESGETLILAGFSFGGYVASQAALRIEDKAQRLVLVGPATSRFDTAPVPPDTLVIQGEVDDVVPLQAVLDWARPQSLPVVVVPGVGHFFHGQLPLLKNLVVRNFSY